MKTNFLAAVFVALAMAGAGCSPAPNDSTGTAGKPDFSTILGYAHQDCFAIKKQGIEPGTSVSIVTLDATQPMLPAKVLGAMTDTASCVLLLEDRKLQNLGDGLSYYKLDLGGKELLSPAIVVLAEQLSVVMEEKVAIVDANADKSPERFTVCTTSEGIQFSVWEGQPWKAAPIWTAYYYMGYAMEPNCPAVE